MTCEFSYRVVQLSVCTLILDRFLFRKEISEKKKSNFIYPKEFPFGFRLEKNFPHKDSQAFEQVAQGGCAIYIPGGFEDQTEQGPEQLGLISELILLEH